MSPPLEPSDSDVPKPEPHARWRRLLYSRTLLTLLAAALMLLLLWTWRPLLLLPGTQPLVMSGGDPYLRALMRTISASESNVMRPYHVVHGGDYVGTLDRHPNRCEAIGQGPNRGNCSTAAGRYQLLFGTWSALALRHHPLKPQDMEAAGQVSFSAHYQDLVVHAWLADSRVWGRNLSQLLRQGQVSTVLRRLSGTWTSLGFGIENNSMSSQLPRIYGRVLKEELELAAELEPEGAPPTPPK